MAPLAGRERDDPDHRALLRDFNVGITVMVNLDCRPDRVGRHPGDLQRTAVSVGLFQRHSDLMNGFIQGRSQIETRL